MGTVSLSVPTVTVEGASKLNSATQEVASSLAKLVDVAEELKAYEVLGQSRAEYVSRIGGVMRASSRRDAVLTLLQNGASVVEAAKAVGCSPGRVTQIKNETDGRTKASTQRVVNFMIEKGADDIYFDDLDLILGRVAKRVMYAMLTEGE